MALKFTDTEFEQEVMQSEAPVLVDFFADWCGPCKMMAPIIDEIASDYEGKIKVGKLNVDENPNSAAKFKVMSIPTIILLKKGEVLFTVVGAVSKKELTDKINTALN